MVVGRTLRASGCAACRISLLRAFTSAPISTIRTQYASNKAPAYVHSFQHIRRSTHEAGTRDKGTRENKLVEVESGLEEPQSDVLDGVEGPPTIEVESVPWYLQVDAPKTEVRPFSERQRLPDLPEDPPSILQPLLQQISVDLGLDDLSLLDLRKLDPPPALGANLLMIIGTTRSEKHLHVSADRLCRWLRSNYRLRPDADGLIGRNELKLKLKRKAKRAKLMGSANDESYDDGVRTGWVCVDVGVVDGVEGTKSKPEESKEFVGFGRQTDGVRIVVQMMTEEKREQIDLEKLWGGILRRGGVKEVEEGSEVDAADGVAKTLPQNGPASNQTSLSGNFSKSSPIGSQSRHLHTSARRSSNQLQGTLASDPDFDIYLKNFVDGLQGVEQTVQRLLTSGNFDGARDFVIDHSADHSLLQNEGWRRFFLHNLKVYLEALPDDQALKALGAGPNDRESTQFLRTFYETVTSYPNQALAESRIWLCCWAHTHQHPNYDSSALFNLSQELQEIGVRIGTGPYLDLIERILQHEPGQEKDYFGTHNRSLRFAAQIIQTMNEQGLPILSQEVLVRLQQAAASGPEESVPSHSIYTDDADTFNLPSHPMVPLQKRLHLLIMHLDLPLFDEPSRLTLMEIYANQKNWVEFWEIWRLAPRHGQPRSSEFYASMFVLVAATLHIKGVHTVLRNWVPELAREDPPIKLEGNVALAVKYCLQVADPRVEEDFEEDPNSPAEWVRMWRRCEIESGGTVKGV